MKHKPLTDQEIRSFRARGTSDRLLEEDHDWHRKQVEVRRSKEKSLIETIAVLNARISELNVVIATGGAHLNKATTLEGGFNGTA